MISYLFSPTPEEGRRKKWIGILKSCRDPRRDSNQIISVVA
ncbi:MULTISPECIES: hypothetical protein [Okeania]|nr:MULTISPECIES: hypothetical protein [Okeania]